MSTKLAGSCPQWATVFLMVLAGASAAAQDEAPMPPPFQWQHGPLEGQLGEHATVTVPEGYVFLDARETVRLLEAMGNPTSGGELGTLAPAAEEESWFLFFEFNDVGYVKDDEKGDLDADALLESIRAGTAEANKERRARGWGEMQIDGWKTQPRYNDSTHNLEWAIRGSSEGVPVLNHNVRLLGRHGVMEVNLVVDPAEYDAAIPQVERLLEHFTFGAGSSYSEYRAGDKIAEYGLATLVAGGAAAVALKSGLFKKFGKLLIVLVVAVAAFFKKIWGKIAGKGGVAHERSQ